MKNLFLLNFLIFFACSSVFSQHSFIVQNINANAFETIDEAYSFANNGDTIYLPGVAISNFPTPVSKSLTWIGVGHYPDSTLATYFTYVSNAVVFNGSTDGTSLIGIFFNSNITFGEAGNNATDIHINRCRIQGTTTFKVDLDTTDINFSITECVTKRLDANNASNCIVEHNNIFEALFDFQSTHFNYNNINRIDNSWARALYNCNNCLFTNNIFTYHHNFSNVINCTFNNNIFNGTINFPVETSTGSNNIFDVGAGNFYTTITGLVSNFEYENDYHLLTNDVSWSTFSTDGTEPGIYGGVTPYKTAAVPFNPHVREIIIPQTTTNGVLPVQIIVGAQNR